MDDVDGLGKMPLHYAAACGNFGIVQYLEKKGCNVNVKDAEGRTAWQLATECHHTGIAQYLADKGADTALVGSTP